MTEGIWHPGLTYLKEKSLIVQAGGDPIDKANVSFSLFTAERPFKRLERISVPKEHY